MLVYLQVPKIYLKSRTRLADTPKGSFLFIFFNGKGESHLIGGILLHHVPELSDFPHSFFSLWLSLSSDYINPVIKVQVICRTALGEWKWWALHRDPNNYHDSRWENNCNPWRLSHHKSNSCWKLEDN